MGLNFVVSKDTDVLEAFITGIRKDADDIGDNMIKVVGEIARKIVIAELNKHRRVLAVRHRPALADDVKLSIRKDKFGERYAQVSGGKRTGTLWHIVNDGNLYSRPTHFLDNAMQKLDEAIDEAWAQAER